MELVISTLIVNSPDNIPTDFMNMFILIITILIILLVLILLFLALLFFWLKRQEKLRYPVKPKIIMRRERSLTKSSINPTNGASGSEKTKPLTLLEMMTAAANNESNTPSKLAKAKPVNESVKSTKLAKAAPIRIAHRHSADTQQKQDDKKKSEAETDKTVADKKSIAKPVHRAHRAKRDLSKDKK